MKFIFLCHSLNIGGLETFILRFSTWLLNNYPECQVELLCKSGEYGAYKQDFDELGVVLHVLPMGYFNPLPYFYFHRLLRSNNYDAICDFSGDFGAFPILVSYMSNITKRLVFFRSARNSFSPTLLKRLYQYLLNWLVLRFSTNILSNSMEAFNHFFPSVPFINDSRFLIIRNGIPALKYLSFQQKESLRLNLAISHDYSIVLHVGSNRWEKNHACILEIAKLAQDNGDKILFCLVGSGVKKTHAPVVAQLGLKNIRFLEERRDVDCLLQISDVFLFPSLSEGQPNAFLEAMISGLPFIASDIAPIRESLPPKWGKRWLFSPYLPKQGYDLLQEHLSINFREDHEFNSLVSWCKNVYDEDKCFGDFFKVLTE